MAALDCDGSARSSQEGRLWRSSTSWSSVGAVDRPGWGTDTRFEGGEDKRTGGGNDRVVVIVVVVVGLVSVRDIHSANGILVVGLVQNTFLLSHRSCRTARERFLQQWFERQETVVVSSSVRVCASEKDGEDDAEV